MASVGGVIILLAVIIVLAALRQHERIERERNLRRWWFDLERDILEELDDVNKGNEVETNTMQVEGQVHPSDG